MTPELKELMRQCGINFHQAGWPELERIAALVVERERCAKVCDKLARDGSNGNTIAIENRKLCAEIIRKG